MNFIGNTTKFPDVNEVDDNMVAIGLRMDTEVVKAAYESGCFPWYNDDEPVLWWCPLERMVIELEGFIFSKRLEQFFNKQYNWTVTLNKEFRAVVTACKEVYRKDQHGTWITNDIIDAYVGMFQQGLAQSVEVWENEELIGGLYGIDLGNGVFCGESMFSLKSGASKYAFIYLVKWLQQHSYTLLDCQMHNDYLAQLGAYIIPKNKYLAYINQL